MATQTLTLSDRNRRKLARTLKDVRLFMDDPARLLERALSLLSAMAADGQPNDDDHE